MTEALSLMWRDLTDAPLLAVFLVLPAAFSIRSVLRGSLLGWIAPVTLVGQLVTWFYYYASDASNVGLGGALEITLIPWALGAVAAVAAYFATRGPSSKAL